MTCGFDDAKMNSYIGDRFAFMKQHKSVFHVITSCTNDPVGAIHALFMFNMV